MRHPSPERHLQLLDKAEARIDAMTTVKETKPELYLLNKADHRAHVDAWECHQIEQAAALPPLVYDQVRAVVAERLNIRTATLDGEVRKRRGETQALGTELFPEIEPWPDPVSGMELLTDLRASVNRFVKVGAHADCAIALWVISTHMLEIADYAPILAITAPEKRCGKSTLLSWLTGIVLRPLPASNMTAPVVFRAVEKWQPTLLIDEADTFLNANDELRGVLNSGHSRKSAFVLRSVGDAHEPCRFSTWCAKSIAMIGTLPDTLADRSINISMRRRLPSESIEKLRNVDDHLLTLHRKCIRFSMDNMETVKNAVPDIPGTIHDRAADNWSTMLAIANVAGGEWPQDATAAAIALTGIDEDGESINIMLLRDVQKTFQVLGCRVLTHQLITHLCKDEEGPWATFNKGKPISPRQLAQRLQKFGIVTNKTIRASDERAKGYMVDQFSDAFARYL